jgi:hypothetical protein
MCAKIALSRRMKRCDQRLTELTFQTLHITELVTFMRVTLPEIPFLAVTHMPHPFAA